METQVKIDAATSLIANGLLQNDLDAAGFKILNLDTSNLSVGAGPLTFLAIPKQFLKSYDSVTRTFSAAQPVSTDLGDFPSIVGKAGQILSTDGVSLLWSVPQGGSGLANKSFLNVKQSPYGAVGDGVTDDYIAINKALTDAAGGYGIYFPKGVYRISVPLVATGAVSLFGDNPYQSIIKLDNGVSAPALLTVGSNSNITRLGFDGNLTTAVQPAQVNRNGIQVNNASGVNIFNCVVSNVSGTGIKADGCFAVIIRDCATLLCGSYGIWCNNSPKSVIVGNRVQGTSLNGIHAVNSAHSTINGNQVYQCGGSGYGIGAFDCDNSVINGNLVQQCLIGIVAAISSSHLASRLSFGYTLNGNNLQRNYYGGILCSLASGINVTGNTVSAGGQGGTDNATYTVEPGVIIDSGNPGSGYVAGDILTLTGGTGTPAKVMVTAVGAGGSIVPGGLVMIFPGGYTVYPSNPFSVTGGSGTGAKIILTGTSVSAAGSGYFVGQLLSANVGSFYNPVRVLVTGVDGAGAVTSYQILDGGGYFGTLPTLLSFTSDAFSPPVGMGPGIPEAPVTGIGFTLLPSFGLRYAQPMNGRASFGISTLGLVNGGIIGNNVIDTIMTGTGILIREEADPYGGRATWLNVSGNSVMNNLYGIKGATGYTLDDVLDPDSLFENNIVYPPTS